MKGTTAIVINGKEHVVPASHSGLCLGDKRLIENMGWEIRCYYECPQCKARSVREPNTAVYLVASLRRETDVTDSVNVCSKACAVAALELLT